MGCTSRTSKPALYLVKPPGPKAETLRLWVISDKGLVWSMNCESCDVEKKSLKDVVIGFALI